MTVHVSRTAEEAYGVNVCDGDYGESPKEGSRPATYIVHNLASLLIRPPPEGSGEVLRTQFGRHAAQSLAGGWRGNDDDEDDDEAVVVKGSRY